MNLFGSLPMDNDEMSNEAKTTETSGSSDSVLMKPTTTTTTKLALSNTSKPRFKGLVPQKNGHYGAQLYAKEKRHWLGTFKSDFEAATAYDLASIQFKKSDKRNFPCYDYTYESEFQKTCTTEAVLNMIKDGSYQHKFRDFLKEKSHEAQRFKQQVRGGGEGGVVYQGSNKFLSCTQLFQKELTPSDVGKLNRLVIPKKYAVKYLPFINIDQNKREKGELGGGGGGAVEDVEVVFYDKDLVRQWKFRYCYWSSSQSFVFTRGWNGFVKEKQLKEKDVIIFYSCVDPSNVETLQGQSENFLMIDVQTFPGNGFVVPDEVNKTVAHDSSDEVMKTVNVFSSKLEDEVTEKQENKGEVKLFGVRIDR